jgi:hypothetical protein
VGGIREASVQILSCESVPLRRNTNQRLGSLLTARARAVNLDQKALMSVQEKHCPQRTDIEGDGVNAIIMSGRGCLAPVIRLGLDLVQ